MLGLRCSAFIEQIVRKATGYWFNVERRKWEW